MDDQWSSDSEVLKNPTSLYLASERLQKIIPEIGNIYCYFLDFVAGCSDLSDLPFLVFSLIDTDHYSAFQPVFYFRN